MCINLIKTSYPSQKKAFLFHIAFVRPFVPLIRHPHRSLDPVNKSVLLQHIVRFNLHMDGDIFPIAHTTSTGGRLSLHRTVFDCIRYRTIQHRCILHTPHPLSWGLQGPMWRTLTANGRPSPDNTGRLVLWQLSGRRLAEPAC